MESPELKQKAGEEEPFLHLSSKSTCLILWEMPCGFSQKEFLDEQDLSEL